MRACGAAASSPFLSACEAGHLRPHHAAGRALQASSQRVATVRPPA